MVSVITTTVVQKSAADNKYMSKYLGMFQYNYRNKCQPRQSLRYVVGDPCLTTMAELTILWSKQISNLNRMSTVLPNDLTKSLMIRTRVLDLYGPPRDRVKASHPTTATQMKILTQKNL